MKFKKRYNLDKLVYEIKFKTCLKNKNKTTLSITDMHQIKGDTKTTQLIYGFPYVCCIIFLVEVMWKSHVNSKVK